MSEKQKNIIEKLLKERKKTKRELARVMNIKENSINRILRNPNISIRKLELIANFLGLELGDLLQMKNAIPLEEPSGEYTVMPKTSTDDQSAMYNLSEAIKIHSKTIEIMAETEKTNSRNIENLVKFLTEKHSNSGE
jgi:transcriptional regulator with XRE-family HTH domain